MANYKSAYDLIPKRYGKAMSLKNAVWIKTTQEIDFLGTTLPIGTEYKVFVSENFGYFCLRESVNGRKIIRY